MARGTDCVGAILMLGVFGLAIFVGSLVGTCLTDRSSALGAEPREVFMAGTVAVHDPVKVDLAPLNHTISLSQKDAWTFWIPVIIGGIIVICVGSICLTFLWAVIFSDLQRVVDALSSGANVTASWSMRDGLTITGHAVSAGQANKEAPPPVPKAGSLAGVGCIL